VDNQAIQAAVISTDADFREAVQLDGGNGDGTVPVRIAFEVVVPFVEISHGHLEELRYVDPDLIFLDLEVDPELGCKLAQFLSEANPSRRIIAAGSEQTPDFLMKVMQAGVNEYLPKPVTPEALSAAVGRARKKLGMTGGAPPEPGQLYAFFAAKGGAGSTTVATNLAIQIHRLTGEETILVDLDLELGEIALFMGVEPRFNFVDLARNFHRMDAGLLATFIEKHESGVHLLSAPPEPDSAESVSGDQTRQILQYLKRHYKHVIVDTSNSFTARTLATFEQAEEVYLVANIDLPSLKNIQRCRHLLERLTQGGREVRLVVNRFQPDNDITLDDVERSLGMEIYWTLPNDYDSVIYSINTGQPVILDERCAYSRELESLGAKITGLPGVETTKKGWFGSKVVDRLKSFIGAGGDDPGEPLMLPGAAAVGSAMAGGDRR